MPGRANIQTVRFKLSNKCKTNATILMCLTGDVDGELVVEGVEVAVVVLVVEDVGVAVAVVEGVGVADGVEVVDGDGDGDGMGTATVSAWVRLATKCPLPSRTTKLDLRLTDSMSLEDRCPVVAVNSNHVVFVVPCRTCTI